MAVAEGVTWPHQYFLVLCHIIHQFVCIFMLLKSLVLVQPRKTRPCLTERLLMGCKESNQINMLLKNLIEIDSINLSFIPRHFLKVCVIMLYTPELI